MAKWKTPEDLKYSKSDEWYRVEGDTVVVGVTDYAQDQLSDIVYVEFPEVGATLKAGASMGVIESVKAASDVYSSVGGTVTAVNSALEDEPEKINADPYGEGWLIKLKADDLSVLDGLMDAASYSSYCENRD